MKRLILFIEFIICACSSIIAQNIKLEKSELESLLFKRWDVEYAMMGSMKVGQIPGAKDFDFLFKRDGSYDVIDEKSTKTGNWKYDKERKYIELSINGKVTSRIKSLDKNKLILILVRGKNDPPGLPKVKVHYKPI
ncbi:hypothetical protein [uncultured Aquimarina sp.]|uniref:hypothetical protein n=1 Tax=uncultured Aquimarina sp. TaxID=575652 RepID=UPI0026177365|nr:hypothetical protein [uncultured Aquimarina sp.]